jgi:hypothetical protein
MYATGGIPLKASPPYIPAHQTFTPIRKINEKKYSQLLYPLVSKSHRVVGLILFLDDVTDDQRVLRYSAIFNGIVASVLWVLTVAFAAVHLRRVRPGQVACEQIPFLDESETLEFKSSLRWDPTAKKASIDVERSVMKAIVGFLNSENGGTVVIGISDSKEVLGLEPDYAILRGVTRNRNGFEQMFRTNLINVIGAQRCVRCVKTRFCSLQGREVCLVSVSPSNDLVFLETGGERQLYVRIGNSTRPFGVEEALTYARDRWGGFAPRSRR